MNRAKIVTLTIVLVISLLSFIGGIGTTLLYQQIAEKEVTKKDTHIQEDEMDMQNGSSETKETESEQTNGGDFDNQKQEVESQHLLVESFDFSNGKTVTLKYQTEKKVPVKDIKEVDYNDEKDLRNNIYEDFEDDYGEYYFYLGGEDAYYEFFPSGIMKTYLITEEALNTRLETTVENDGIDEITKSCSLEDKTIKDYDFKVLNCETRYKSNSSDTDYVRTVEDKFCMYSVSSDQYFLIETLQAPMDTKNTCELLETNLVFIEVK